jgi:hypothetical protein
MPSSRKGMHVCEVMEIQCEQCLLSPIIEEDKEIAAVITVLTTSIYNVSLMLKPWN